MSKSACSSVCFRDCLCICVWERICVCISVAWEDNSFVNCQSPVLVNVRGSSLWRAPMVAMAAADLGMFLFKSFVSPVSQSMFTLQTKHWTLLDAIWQPFKDLWQALVSCGGGGWGGLNSWSTLPSHTTPLAPPPGSSGFGGLSLLRLAWILSTSTSLLSTTPAMPLGEDERRAETGLATALRLIRGVSGLKGRREAKP